VAVVWFQKDVPPWLPPIADKLGVLVTGFDTRSVTTRNPFVVLLDAREEDPVTLATRARGAFGDEAVLCALTGLEGLPEEALSLVDVSAPASTQVVLPVLRLALSLASERRKRKTAESRAAHAKQPSDRIGFDPGGEALSAARLGIATLDANLVCVGWNRFMEQRFGVAASKVLGKTLQGAALPVPLHALAERALLGEVVDSGEMQSRVDAGAALWLNVIANPISDDGAGPPRGVAVIVRDLTPQRVAEELRRQTEREFRGLLDSLPESGILHVDGRVTFANATTAATLLEADAAVLVGRQFTSLFTPEDRQLVAAHVLRIQGGARVPPEEVRFLRRDGGILLVEMTSAVVHFDGREGVFSVARDVTERKELQERAATTDRLVSMGVLAAGVAHEINNPLTALVSSLDFLDEEMDLLLADATPARRDDLHDLLLTSKEATFRIRDIVRDLRLFTRPNEERKSHVDLRETLESTARLARIEIRHRARLVKDFGPVPPVFGNEARLGQVFLNLVMNAAQAIEEGDVERNEILLSTSTDDEGRAVVEVRDTGRGIPSAILPHIFDPFFTTKPVGIGTGLGLSISRRIVMAAGGTLEATSEPGHGAVFRVTLPPSDARPATLLSDAPKPASAQRGRVLVVDDDVAVRRALIRMLGETHDLVTVSSGAEAIETIHSGERFDVVLCDLMMPRVTGDRCYERVLEIDADQARKFVFMTGGA
jgi:two-component system, cell cycle sensor histidine kinase and response regulator CckA